MEQFGKRLDTERQIKAKSDLFSNMRKSYLT